MYTDEFLEMLVGHWHNLQQAQSSPASFAYVHYLWYWDGQILKTKQWYDYNPDEPYRERNHFVWLRQHDLSLILETYNPQKGGEKAADTVWTKTPRGWTGKTDPNCKHPDGIKVKTAAILEDNKFHTDDRGWDKGGNLLWGSNKGPFEFTKCDTK